MRLYQIQLDLNHELKPVPGMVLRLEFSICPDGHNVKVKVLTQIPSSLLPSGWKMVHTGCRKYGGILWTQKRRLCSGEQLSLNARKECFKHELCFSRTLVLFKMGGDFGTEKESGNQIDLTAKLG